MVLGFFELNISKIFLDSTQKTLRDKADFNASIINAKVLEEVHDITSFHAERFVHENNENRLYFNKEEYLSDKNLDNIFAKSSFNNSEYIFVVDKFGNIFYSSKNKYRMCYYENLYNFFDKIRLESDTTIDQIQEKIVNKNTDTFIYTVSGQKRMCCYAPVPSLGWYVFTVVPMNYVSEQEQLISAIFFIIIIINVFAFVVSYIILKHNLRNFDYLDTTKTNDLSVYNQKQYMLMEFDFENEIIELTGDSEFLLGHKYNKIPITDFVKFLKNIHPNDSIIVNQIKDFIKNQGFNFSAEFRFLCSDSKYYWFHLNSSNIFDKEGHNVKYIVHVVNVNSRTMIYQDKKENLHFDELTGLLNKEYFEDKALTFLTKTKNKSTSALFIINLDDIQKVNIKLGHSYGDIAIKNAAKHISLIFNQKDIIGRIRGNDFAVLLCLNKSLSEEKAYNIIYEKAQMLCNELKLSYSDKRRNAEVTASVGIALYPFHGQDYSQLLQAAESALFAVKQNGKNGYKIYTHNKTTE